MREHDETNLVLAHSNWWKSADARTNFDSSFSLVRRSKHNPQLSTQ